MPACRPSCRPSCQSAGQPASQPASQPACPASLARRPTRHTVADTRRSRLPTRPAGTSGSARRRPVSYRPRSSLPCAQPAGSSVGWPATPVSGRAGRSRPMARRRRGRRAGETFQNPGACQGSAIRRQRPLAGTGSSGVQRCTTDHLSHRSHANDRPRCMLSGASGIFYA